MQRVFQVRFSGDGRFVLSGSDDTNIRIWKSNASERLGVLLEREKASLSYQAKLRDRYSSLPEISRIQRFPFLLSNLFSFLFSLFPPPHNFSLYSALCLCERLNATFTPLSNNFCFTERPSHPHRKRHLPKAILNQAKLRVVMKEAKNRKLRNVRAHTKPGTVPHIAARTQSIVEEVE